MLFVGYTDPKSCRTNSFLFVQNGSTKTLAFFEGCNPKLGATIVLRGAKRKELMKVRDVLRFMVFVAYNSKLEKAFIMDEFGTPFVEEDEARNHEITDDNSVVFSIEGHEQNDSNAEMSKEGEVCTLNDTGGPSIKSEETSVEKNPTTKKDSNLASDEFDSDNNQASFPCEVTSDLLAKVVNGKSFQNILDNVVLSSSPLVKYSLPYVLTPQGQQCELREFTTGDLYWSPLFFGESSADRSSSEDEADSFHEEKTKNVSIKATHPFVFAMVEKDGRDPKLLELLANYRAEGGRIVLRKRDESTLNGSNESGEGKKKPNVQGSTPGSEFEHGNRQGRTDSDLHRSQVPQLVSLN